MSRERDRRRVGELTLPLQTGDTRTSGGTAHGSRPKSVGVRFILSASEGTPLGRSGRRSETAVPHQSVPHVFLSPPRPSGHHPLLGVAILLSTRDTPSPVTRERLSDPDPGVSSGQGLEGNVSPRGDSRSSQGRERPPLFPGPGPDSTTRAPWSLPRFTPSLSKEVRTRRQGDTSSRSPTRTE